MAGRGIFILCSAGALLSAARAAGAPEQRGVAVAQEAQAARPARERPPVASGPPPAVQVPATPAGVASPALREPAEPALAEVMAAAARVSAGTVEEEESRLSRARSAHWAPQLRAQAGRADSESARAGVQSSAPLHWDQQGQVDTWQVSATWDLAQLIYDRDENQLALSRVHLARRRHEAALEAAERYVERQKLLSNLAARPRDGEAALALLRCTGALDSLTGGLYAEALGRAQVLIAPPRAAPGDPGHSSSGPSAGATPGLRNGPSLDPEPR